MAKGAAKSMELKFGSTKEKVKNVAEHTIRIEEKFWISNPQNYNDIRTSKKGSGQPYGTQVYI